MEKVLATDSLEHLSHSQRFKAVKAMFDGAFTGSNHSPVYHGQPREEEESTSQLAVQCRVVGRVLKSSSFSGDMSILLKTSGQTDERGPIDFGGKELFHTIHNANDDSKEKFEEAAVIHENKSDQYSFEELMEPSESDNCADTNNLSPLSVEYVSKRVKKMSVNNAATSFDNDVIEKCPSTIAPGDDNSVDSCDDARLFNFGNIQKKNNQIFIDEVLEETPPKINIFPPDTDYTDLRVSFMEVLHGQQQKTTKNITCKLERNKPELIPKHLKNHFSSGGGRLLVRVLQAEMKEWDTIQSSKSINNGHLAVIVSLGGQGVEYLSNQLAVSNQQSVLFDPADNALNLVDGGEDLLTISAFFQYNHSMNEVSDPLKTPSNNPKLKKPRGIKSNFFQFINKRKSTVGSGADFSSSSITQSTNARSNRKSVKENANLLFDDCTDKFADNSSHFSTRTFLAGTELLIARSEISLRHERYSQILSGKVLELEIRFDENNWLKCLKLACCYLVDCDINDMLLENNNSSSGNNSTRNSLHCSITPTSVDKKTIIPKTLSECGPFMDKINFFKSINQEGLVSVKTSSQRPALYQQREGANATTNQQNTNGISKQQSNGIQTEPNRTVEMKSIQRITTHTWDELSAGLPKAIRIYMKKEEMEKKNSCSFIDIICRTKEEFNAWISNLTTVYAATHNLRQGG